MKRDLFENDENEAFDKEDTSKGENCYFCDSKFRTGWKSNQHFGGEHLLRIYWDQMNILLFLSSTLICVLFQCFSHSH